MLLVTSVLNIVNWCLTEMQQRFFEYLAGIQKDCVEICMIVMNMLKVCFMMLHVK